MQKLGDISLMLNNGSKLKAFIAYYTDDLSITRFEVFDDSSRYDILNTEYCIAAYYKDTVEYRDGNDEIITKVLLVLDSVVVTPGVTDRETDFSNGIITFKNVKHCNDGSEYRYTTVNGVVTEESFLTSDAYIRFTSIDSSNNTVLTPVNLQLYENINDFGTVISGDSSGLDYYTEEQLRSRYGQKIDHLYSYDFRIAKSLEEAFDWLDEFRKTDSKLVAIDIESTGLDMDMYGDDCMTSVGVASNVNGSMIFPFRQKGCSYNLPRWFFSEIADAVNSLPDDVRVGTYNGKMEIVSFWKERPEHVKYSSKSREWEDGEYEMSLKGVAKDTYYTPTQRVLSRLKCCDAYQKYLEDKAMCNHGLWIRSDVDGFHLSMKIDQRRGKGIHTLKTLATKVTGLFWLELEQIFKGSVKFDVLPPNIIVLYAGADPCNTIRVIEALEKELPKSMRKVTELEHKLTYVKSENEYYGMRTDVELLNKSIARYTYMKNMLERRIKEIHHTTKNIRSNDVKKDIFYNQLKAPVTIYTNTGEPSTSKEALKTIIDYGTLPKDKCVKGLPDLVMFVDKNGFITEAPKDGDMTDKEKVIVISGEELGSNRYPSLLMFRKYSAVCKELGALERIKKKSHNGRVTFYIISDGAESDRQTSDAHQYSDTMKKMILSDSDSHYLLSCDYTQVELRILAYLAGQKDLIELCKISDVDVHRAILSIITGKPIHLISDKERKEGKSTNFGVVYGMTAFGLTKKQYGIMYTKEQFNKCQQSITDFYNGMPNVKKFCNESEETVLRDKEIMTAFGYIRQFPQLRESTISKKARSKAIKGANNTRIQGFAATMMKIAEVNYYNYIRIKGWDKLVDCNGVMLPMVRMMLSIHDEVLISAHKSIPVPEIIEMCKVCQEIKIKDAPPFFAAPAFVANWYLGKSSKYEIPIKLRDEIVEEYHKGRNIIDMDNYVGFLTEYRDGVLHNYMRDLIRKYKTADEVAKHVDDPTLTHVLISVCIKDNEKMEHEEKIRVSVERFMEGHIEDVSVEEETDDYNNFIDDSEEIGKYISYDENGEQVIEYVDDETEEECSLEDGMSEDASEEDESKAVNDEYTIYTMESCLVDMTNVYRMANAEKAHKELMYLADKNKGDYRLLYVVGSKIIDTHKTIGYVCNDINNIVQSAIINEEVS